MRDLPSEDWHDLLVVEVALYEAQHHQHSSHYMVGVPANPQMRLSFGCISLTHVACMGNRLFESIQT